MIALARKHQNVYIDTSAYTPKRFPPELVTYLRGGHHKVLFGTNYPMITAENALAGLDSLGLDIPATSRYLHDHAERLFALDGTPST